MKIFRYKVLDTDRFNDVTLLLKKDDLLMIEDDTAFMPVVNRWFSKDTNLEEKYDYYRHMVIAHPEKFVVLIASEIKEKYNNV